jgi:Skp family chaperone for outer membrane proteins
MGGLRGLALVLALLAGPAPAQETGGDGPLTLGQVRSPVLTIDPERLYAESLFGQRIADEIRAEAEALDRENQRIEAALTEEERGLTLLRPTMAVADFRAAAEDFDSRVQAIREAQDAKERSLQQALQQGQAAFLDAATPVLAEIMIEAGAAVILDRRSVFLGVGAVDVTDRAIEVVNARIGDGATMAPPDPAPAEAADAETDGSPGIESPAP